jgi:phage-related minor tail protein
MTLNADDVAHLDAEMQRLSSTADQVADSIASAFTRGIARGRDLEDVLKSLGQRLIEIGLNAALKPIENGIGNLLSQAFGSLSSVISGAGQPLSVLPFADGGIIGSPAIFPMGSSIGLAGERGAEAIMPLARGVDGKLGVALSGGRSSASIQVNITTPDAQSFRRSEVQVTSAIARAVARGQRGL